MGRTVAIGLQDFGDLIQKGYFYIDKTPFIKEWWENGDSALKQIEDKKYAEMLIARGISEDRIRCYGFAFEGKKVLIKAK